MSETGAKRLLDDPKKLAAFLASLNLRRGCHGGIEQGASVMEAVSYIAGEEWSESPKCASQVVSMFADMLNQAWGDDERQQLKPFIPRIATTAASDEIEGARAWMCADWAIRQTTPLWLDAAGQHERAAELRALLEIKPESYDDVKLHLPWGWRPKVWALMEGELRWQPPKKRSAAYEDVAFAAINYTDHAMAVVYADPDAEQSPTHRPAQSWSRICDAAKEAVGDRMAPTRAKSMEMSLELLRLLIERADSAA